MIIGVILVALFYMCQDFPTIDERQWFQKLIISTMLGGAIASALLAIWLDDILGRKKLIIFYNFFQYCGCPNYCRCSNS